MARLSMLLAIQAVASTIAFALPSRSLSSRAAPLNPTADPFYQPPSGFEAEAPGTILRNRTINASFFGLIPDPIEAWQLLYRTTAINGSAIATVTTIFKSDSAKLDRFVAFSTAYDSAAPQCQPSYTYQLGTPQNDLVSDAEFLAIQAYLLSGYIVSSSDYEGPDSAFSAGHLEGMGVLDSIRAVTNFSPTLKLTTSKPSVVGVGYSGGAIATGWAAALHSLYAPELNIAGWVAGGTPANLTSTTLYVDNTIFSGFLPPAIDGLNKPSTYGAELSPLIDRIITPKGRAILDYANTHCVDDDLGNFFHESLLDPSIQTEGARLLYDPVLQPILAFNTLGANRSETPIAPVLLYHAEQDEIIPYNSTVELVDTWCADGVSVKFTTFGNGGHITTEIVGLPGALSFVESAFEGTLEPGCTRDEELGSILNPLALGVELEPILTGLLELLLDAGDGDENIKKNITVLAKGGSKAVSTRKRVAI